MKTRILNPRHKRAAFYNRLEIHPEWVESYSSFLAAVGRRPSVSYSLDRIENSEGYVPGNVRWATRIEQANNTSRNRITDLEGKTRTVSEWARHLGVSPYTIYDRLNRGKTILGT